MKPYDVKDLEDPAFLAWLDNQTVGAPVQPKKEDFDTSAEPVTDEECAKEYRLAQARCLLRLWGEWKSGQN